MITITFELDGLGEVSKMVDLYERMKEQRKSKDALPTELSDFEKRMQLISLDDLVCSGKLDVRSANCLKCEHLYDAYSIYKMFAIDGGHTMRKIPNLGQKSLTRIKDLLAELGFFPNQVRTR